ncbi:MAG: hypothetical protein ABI439_13175 [Rhodospirillales bacterium]
MNDHSGLLCVGGRRQATPHRNGILGRRGARIGGPFFTLRRQLWLHATLDFNIPEYRLMIDLLPLPNEEFFCVCSNTKLVNEAFILTGMMPVVQGRCPKCGRRLLSHPQYGWKFGSRLQYDESDNSVVTADNLEWYVNMFRSAMASRGQPAPGLSRVTHRPLGRNVVIVNAVEPTYGHILQRLFSIEAMAHDLEGADLLVIVPRHAAWLVPDGAAELWIVEAPATALSSWNQAVADAVAALADQVDRLRLAPLRLGGYAVDISRFTRVKPFDPRLATHVAPARLCISWREDRCWTYRGQPLETSAAIVEQFTMYSQMLDMVRAEIPDLEVTVFGYGRKGTFAPWVEDLRNTEHDPEMEKTWAQRCSQSHLVFGIQGSNMILPAGHAFGSVELMPLHNWAHNMATWEWVNRMAARTAMQRYLHIPLSTSFSDVVSIVFIQLRRMQQQSLWLTRTQPLDADESSRLALAAISIAKPVQPLEYRNAAGQVM